MSTIDNRTIRFVEHRSLVRFRNASLVCCLFGAACWAGLVVLVVWALGGDVTPDF